MNKIWLLCIGAGMLCSLHGEPKYFGCIWKSQWTTPGACGKYFGDVFNQVTPESAGKHRACEPTRGNFNWTVLDAMYKWADSTGAKTKEHTFAWGPSDPDWVKNGSITTSAEMKAAIENFIASYCRRFEGKIDMIDVANEIANWQGPSYIPLIGGNGESGCDWLIWLFQTARKYAPNAELILNEFDLFIKPTLTQDFITKFVNPLKQRGLIDGIGEQCHQYFRDDQNINADTALVRQQLNILAATGLDIHISEMAVWGADQYQLEAYKKLIPIYWNHPSVKGITLWGYKQGDMYEPNCFLVHSDGSERPAMTWLRQYFSTTKARNRMMAAAFKAAPEASIQPQLHLVRSRGEKAGGFMIYFGKDNGLGYNIAGRRAVAGGYPSPVPGHFH